MSNKLVNAEHEFYDRLYEGIWLAFCTFVFVCSLCVWFMFRHRRVHKAVGATALCSGLLLSFGIWSHLDPFVDPISINPDCSVFDSATTKVSFKAVKVIMWFDGQVGGLVSERHNREYAEKVDDVAFERLMGCAPTGRALQWAKIALLRKEMERVAAEWLVWIDSDAVFTNWRVSLVSELRRVGKGVHMIVGGDLESLGRPLNTGFMAVRVGADGRALLDKIWTVGAKLGRKWIFGHEQEALTVLVKTDPLVRSQVLIWKKEVRMFSEKDTTLQGRERE